MPRACRTGTRRSPRHAVSHDSELGFVGGVGARHVEVADLAQVARVRRVDQAQALAVPGGGQRRARHLEVVGRARGVGRRGVGGVPRGVERAQGLIRNGFAGVELVSALTAQRARDVGGDDPAALVAGLGEVLLGGSTTLPSGTPSAWTPPFMGRRSCG